MNAASRFAERSGDQVLSTAAWAGVLSGLPSTLYALALGRDPLEAATAAGSILLPHEQRKARLLVAAIPIHLGLSLAWSLVMASVLPGRHPIREGVAAGLAIAALDLGVVGRRFPRIRDLETLPQVVDHVTFGVIVAERLVQHRGRKREGS